MKNIDMPYGDSFIEASIPDAWECVELAGAQAGPSGDFKSLVAEKLISPDTGPGLGEMAVESRTAAVLVPDMTRKLDLPLILSEVIGCLNGAGISDEEVRILIAAGAHRPLTRDELNHWIGPEIFNRIKVENHNCDDKEFIDYLGETEFGTPVELNRNAVRADLRVLIGAVTFHYFAGFGGGRKAIMPGVASRRAIIKNHGLTLDADGRKNPCAATANLDSNPLHLDMLQAAEKAGPCFILNVIPGFDGSPVNLAAGELDSAHRIGCDWALEKNSVMVPAPLDGVMVSCGGSPKDVNFIQAHKALDHCYKAVKPGGVIILAARCAEGLGSRGIGEWIMRGSAPEILELIAREYSIPGHTVYCAKSKALRNRILLVSELDPEAVEAMGMIPATDLQKAVEIVRAGLTPNPRVGLVFRGGDTLLRLCGECETELWV